MDDQIKHPWLKAITALAAGFGVSSWSDFAAFVAAVYTLVLMAEWFWKKFWRPLLERHGIVKRRNRRASDREAS